VATFSLFRKLEMPQSNYDEPKPGATFVRFWLIKKVYFNKQAEQKSKYYFLNILLNRKRHTVLPKNIFVTEN
jgi:hypothetical protein